MRQLDEPLRCQHLSKDRNMLGLRQYLESPWSMRILADPSPRRAEIVVRLLLLPFPFGRIKIQYLSSPREQIMPPVALNGPDYRLIVQTLGFLASAGQSVFSLRIAVVFSASDSPVVGRRLGNFLKVECCKVVNPDGVASSLVGTKVLLHCDSR